jgi:hypothetical protein
MEPARPHSNGTVNRLSDLRNLTVAVEILTNLIFLASRDAGSSENVRSYLH